MFDSTDPYAAFLLEQERLQSAEDKDQKDQVEEPDPMTPAWEAAQPNYQLCTPEQINDLFHLRGAIRTAFASSLGLIRQPKKATR